MGVFLAGLVSLKFAGWRFALALTRLRIHGKFFAAGVILQKDIHCCVNGTRNGESEHDERNGTPNRVDSQNAAH